MRSDEPIDLEPEMDGQGSEVWSRRSPSWDEVNHMLGVAERGGKGMVDVGVTPGGALQLYSAGITRPLSKLPNDIMAAVTVGPRPADVDELRRLDPGNDEGWTPVDTTWLSGWKFSFQSPIEGQPPFEFLAFKSPSEGGWWRISVLRPNLDRELGHRPHHINIPVGSREVPVLCGPGGRPASSLAEVRVFAAKWMVYTSGRLAGLRPSFSW